jgi:hypothetical protein
MNNMMHNTLALLLLVVLSLLLEQRYNAYGYWWSYNGVLYEALIYRPPECARKGIKYNGKLETKSKGIAAYIEKKTVGNRNGVCSVSQNLI